MLATGFFVVHDATAGCKHDVSKTKKNCELPSRWCSIVILPKLTRWQKCVRPLLNVQNGHIKSRADDSGFVQSSCEVDDDLSSSVVVDDFELANVSVLHHHRQEFDDDFGVRADENLSLASFLSIVYALEGIG